MQDRPARLIGSDADPAIALERHVRRVKAVPPIVSRSIDVALALCDGSPTIAPLPHFGAASFAFSRA